MDEISSFRRFLRRLAPILVLILAVLLMVAPIRPAQGFVPMPSLPLYVIFLYAVYDADALPAPVVFFAGLLQDLLYGSALGVSAAAFLGVQYLVLTQEQYLEGRVVRVVWVAFALVVTTVAFGFWLLRSLLASSLLPVMPLLYQLFTTVALYPLASMLFFYLRRRAAAEEWDF